MPSFWRVCDCECSKAIEHWTFHTKFIVFAHKHSHAHVFHCCDIRSACDSAIYQLHDEQRTVHNRYISLVSFISIFLFLRFFCLNLRSLEIPLSRSVVSSSVTLRSFSHFFVIVFLNLFLRLSNAPSIAYLLGRLRRPFAEAFCFIWNKFQFSAQALSLHHIWVRLHK